MRLSKLLCLVVLLITSGCLTDNPSDPAVRLNISGLIVTGPMIGMKSMKERGVKSVAFVMMEENQIQFTYTGITIFENQSKIMPLGVIMNVNPNRASFIERLKHLDGINYVDISAFENDITNSIGFSKWDGAWSFAKGSESISAKLSDMGVDVLLLLMLKVGGRSKIASIFKGVLSISN